MRLHTHEDGVGREAGQTALDVRLASQLLSLSIQVIQRPHRLFKLLFIDLQNMENRRKRQNQETLQEARSMRGEQHARGFCPCWDILSAISSY